jgi:hypothetical protein
LPELESTRLGGSDRPGKVSHISGESNGKHRFARVDTFIEEGIVELSIEEKNGAIETGKSESSSPIIKPGANEEGLLRSPREKSLENRSLEITPLPIGRSTIGLPWKHFA